MARDLEEAKLNSDKLLEEKYNDEKLIAVEDVRNKDKDKLLVDQQKYKRPLRCVPRCLSENEIIREASSHLPFLRLYWSSYPSLTSIKSEEISDVDRVNMPPEEFAKFQSDMLDGITTRRLYGDRTSGTLRLSINRSGMLSVHHVNSSKAVITIQLKDIKSVERMEPSVGQSTEYILADIPMCRCLSIWDTSSVNYKFQFVDELKRDFVYRGLQHLIQESLSSE
eukprot:743691_1